jgi:hypothetical protein
MSGKSNALAELILALIYKGVTDPELASAPGSATDVYFALHTADPGDASGQDNHEPTSAQYPGYARVAVARGAGFTEPTSNNGMTSVHPLAPITFPTTNSQGVGCVLTHFSIGVSSTGPGRILYSGQINTPVAVTAGVAGIIPQLTTATVIQES